MHPCTKTCLRFLEVLRDAISNSSPCWKWAYQAMNIQMEPLMTMSSVVTAWIHLQEPRLCRGFLYLPCRMHTNVLVLPMYIVHPYFSLKNLGKKCAWYTAKYSSTAGGKGEDIAHTHTHTLCVHLTAHLVLSSRAVVPNLFGTKDWFFHGGWGGNRRRSSGKGQQEMELRRASWGVS